MSDLIRENFERDKDKEWAQKYRYCRVCGGEVNDETMAWAMRRHEQQTCSTECQRSARLKFYACCDKAEQRPCVCEYSTTCPEHGDRCHGTHD